MTNKQSTFRTLRRAFGGNLPIVALVVLGLLCVAMAAPWGSAGPVPQKQAVPSQGVKETAQYGRVTFKPIREMQLGERVVGHNPQLDQEDVEAIESIRPEDWRKVTLRMPKGDGGILDVQLLRPLSWLEELEVQKGKRIDLAVEELDVEAQADVLDVAPCPPIRSGTGNVVTGVYHHFIQSSVEMQFKSVPAPVKVSGNHPFWSALRQDFVRADSLRPGEEVLGLDGLTTLTSIVPRAGPLEVYNLEVNGENVYLVTAQGLLVHNASSCQIGKDAEKYAAAWLKSKGYKVLGRMQNHSNQGLDLIAKNVKSGNLVILEVKANTARLSTLQKEGGARYLQNVLGRVQNDAHWAARNLNPGTREMIDLIQRAQTNGATIEFMVLRVKAAARSIAREAHTGW